MTPDHSDSLQRHLAGATVVHQSPFRALEVPTSNSALPVRIQAQWVDPLYFGLNQPGVPAFLEQNLNRAGDEVIDLLLKDVNWRSRVAGALLVALLDRRTFAERIGRLLLRSDVCYAGAIYCQELASFNDAHSVDVLQRYLDYYLEHKELEFDQDSAMAALTYLDGLNGTALAARYESRWQAFAGTQSSRNLERSCQWFQESMRLLQRLRRPRTG
jgi:hypothetical protein